jgi:CRP-like cAMP-binding protein
MSSFLPVHPDVIRAVPPDIWRMLRAEGNEVSFAAGQIIHQAGDIDRSLSLILAGRVRFRRIDLDGKDVSVTTVGRGRTFGEISLLTGRPRTHDAIAETPVRLVRVPITRMQALLDQETELRSWLTLELAYMAEKALDLLDDRNRLSATQSVARALANTREIRVVVRQSELAQSLNLSRKAVNRALGLLRDAGMISTGYGEIQITDRSALTDFASASPWSGRARNVR